MILAVDIGNTKTTVALLDGQGALQFLSELGTELRMTEDQCAIGLMGVFQLYGHSFRCVTGAILSSVVPPVTEVYAQAIRRVTGQSPLVVGPGLKTGLNIKAEVHNQLGSDIVACAVAAAALYPSPAIVINANTAVSFSYMSHSAFEGCAIMPGMGIALEALSQHGAQLPHISMGRVHTPLGRNTVDSMRTGMIYGYAGAIDRLIEMLEEAVGVEAACVIATGEDMPEVFGRCKREIVYDHDLLVRGLFLLYQKNCERAPRRTSQDNR